MNDENMAEKRKKTYISSILNMLFNVCVFMLRSNKVPKHIGLIPDNNRTFSKRKGIPLGDTYKIRLIETIKLAKVFGVRYLTVYLISPGNFERREEEIYAVLENVLKFVQMLLANPMDCRYVTIGDTSKTPDLLQKNCQSLTKATENNSGPVISLAINYISKMELTDASFKIINEYKNNFLSAEDINETLIQRHLYMEVGNVDLFIRTSIHKRLSGYLLWQGDKGLQYHIVKCWPEFTKWDLLRAICYYQFYIKHFGLKDL